MRSWRTREVGNHRSILAVILTLLGKGDHFDLFRLGPLGNPSSRGGSPSSAWCPPLRLSQTCDQTEVKIGHMERLRLRLSLDVDVVEAFCRSQSGSASLWALP